MVKTVNLEEEGMDAIQNLVDGMRFNDLLNCAGDRKLKIRVGGRINGETKGIVCQEMGR